MRAIDLFCGAGGFSCGFEQAGINVEYGIDRDAAALETFEQNHAATALNYDITNAPPDKILSEEFDVVFGSPPCQGFSNARGERSLDDEKNELVFHFIQWVETLEPDVVVMENVAGMTTISDDFMTAVRDEYRDAGYTIEWGVLNAADFGVPQTRERVIVIATPTDSNTSPSLPEGEHFEFTSDDGTQTSLEDGTTPKTWVTVHEAIEDLPDPTQNGTVDLPELSDYPNNDYLPRVRDGATKTRNHMAKTPASDEDTQRIVERLQPGEMYRSNRFGERHRGVWDILEEHFTEVQQDILEFIGRNRSRNDVYVGEKTLGPIPPTTIVERMNYSEPEIQTAITDLLNDGWLRKKEIDGVVAYDINTKSGSRPRYMRIKPYGQSNTILTNDFEPRDKLHPTENRGLSLREGARLQSFPDTFRFYGTFNTVSNQIGNAVPPLMAQEIAEHIQ